MAPQTTSPSPLGFRADNSTFQERNHEVEWLSHSLEANGISIRLHETKPTTPLPKLVFLHGLCGAGPVLIPLLSQISDSFHVCLPDARGHGESNSIPEGSFTMDNLVADAAAAIKQFSPESPVYLAGHSMGASTAARVAKLHPDLVRGLILEDPPWLRNESEAVERPGDAILSSKDPSSEESPEGERKGSRQRGGLETREGREGGRRGGKTGGRGHKHHFGGIFHEARVFKTLSPEEFAKKEPEAKHLPKHAYTMARSLLYLAADSIEATFRETDDVINEAVEGISMPALLWTGNPTGVCKPEVAQTTVATWQKGALYNWPHAGHVIHAHPRGQEYLKKMRDFFSAIDS